MEDKSGALGSAKTNMREAALLHIVQATFNQIADMTDLPWAVRRVILTGLRLSVMEAVYQGGDHAAVADYIAEEVAELLQNQTVEVWLRVQIVEFMASEVQAMLSGSPGEAAD